MQKECDRKTWEKDLTNREKTLVRITCSPEIEASIAFLGHAWFIIHMDEEVKLWTAGFCLIAKNEHFGGPLFKSFEQAKAFVDRFIALGCPAFESLQWTHFLAEFNDV